MSHWTEEKMTGLEELTREDLIDLLNEHFRHRLRLASQITGIARALESNEKICIDMDVTMALASKLTLKETEIH
jgi:hypothetical protein